MTGHCINNRMIKLNNKPHSRSYTKPYKWDGSALSHAAWKNGIANWVVQLNPQYATTLRLNVPYPCTDDMADRFLNKFFYILNRALNLAIYGRRLLRRTQKNGLAVWFTGELLNTSPHFHGIIRTPVPVYGLDQFVDSVWKSVIKSGDTKTKMIYEAKGWADYCTKHADRSSYYYCSYVSR